MGKSSHRHITRCNTEIAKHLGKGQNKSTISREIHGAPRKGNGRYDAREANSCALERVKNRGKRARLKNEALIKMAMASFADCIPKKQTLRKSPIKKYQILSISSIRDPVNDLEGRHLMRYSITVQALH